MTFVEEGSFYRRFTRVFHILGAAAAFSLAYSLMSIGTASSDQSIFQHCAYANALFILSWGINVGITTWLSFVAGPVMLKNLNRHVFTEVQSYLFPFYFFLQGLTSCIQLFVFLYMKHNLSAFSQQDIYVMVSIDAGILCGFVNGLWAGPILTQIGFKRIAMEKEEGVVSPNIGPKLKENPTYSKLKKRFGKFHGISTLLNLFSFAGNMYVLFFISSELMKVGKVAAAM